MCRATWGLAVVLVLLVAGAGAAPAETAHPILAGTTIISGDRPGSLVVTVPSAASIGLNAQQRGPAMSVDGPDDKVVGFLIEPIDDPSKRVVGWRFPKGYGPDGDPEYVGYTNEPGRAADLAPGDYRLWLLTEDGTEASVTLELMGLTGSVSLNPQRSSSFVADRVTGEADELGDTYYSRGVERRVPGGGYVVNGVSFRGDPGSAVYFKSCIYFNGTTYGDTAHAAPACLPRDTGGRNGFAGTPGVFVPITEGAGIAREFMVSANADWPYAVSFSALRIGPVKDLQTISLWIGRE